MLFRTLCVLTTLALATTTGSVPLMPKAKPQLKSNPEIVPISKPMMLFGDPSTGSLIRRAMPFPRYLAIRAQYDENYVSNVGMPPKPDVPPPPAYPEFPPQSATNPPSAHHSPPAAPQNATHSGKKGETRTKNVQRIKAKGQSSENVKGKSS